MYFYLSLPLGTGVGLFYLFFRVRYRQGYLGVACYRRVVLSWEFYWMTLR
jgi:hypothetical protein